MKLRLSITQQIYVILVIILIFGLLSLALKKYHSIKTLDNFQTIQDKQLKLSSITDNIKTKLAKIQNLEVQRIVDIMSAVKTNNSTNSLDDLKKDLVNLTNYAQKNKSEELKAIAERIDIRYTLLLNQHKSIDVKEIKADPEEAIMAIETIVAISGKINEELSKLIDISHTQLETSFKQLEVNIKDRLFKTVVVNMTFIIILLIGGVFFIQMVKSKIHLLIEGAHAFYENRFDYRIPVKSDECYDELCHLAMSFNNMATSIEDLVDKQKKANEILDQKVKEQTLKIQKNLEELEKSNVVVMDSINYASKIQHALLPDKHKMANKLGDHFVIWNQRDVVGGDFYWMEEVEDGYIVALIDCTGHGVPGSLMTMISIPALDKIIREYQITSPSMILRTLNRSLKDILKKDEKDLNDDGLDAGICYVNIKENCVYFASAGIPLFYTKDGDINEIKGDKRGIGYKNTDDEYDFKEHQIQIDSTMSFYMATDGITEQVGGEQKRMMFGRKRLRELLKNIHIKNKYEQKNLILETLSDYRGNEPQKDDMTCISFKVENK